MKFQPDTLAGVNVISRFEPGRVWVGATPHEASVVVPWRGAVIPWPPADGDALQPEHFEQLAGLQPEVVLFGSGERLRFPRPALLRGLIERRIGVETMDSGAACRTFNVLAAEGRAVVVALLLGIGRS